MSGGFGANNFREVVQLLREENERLREQLSTITDADADWRLPDYPNLPLTPSTRKVLKVLFMKMNRTVRAAALYQLLYSTRPESQQPTAEVVAVLMSKLRRVLRGTVWRIDTVWGSGWKLVQRKSRRQNRVDNRTSSGLRLR